MKKIALFINLTVFFAILNSCSNSSKVIGCWQDQHSRIINLMDDGTLIKGSREGTWKLIDDDRLYFKWDNGENDTHTIVKISSGSMVIKYNGLLEFTWIKEDCD